MTDIVERLRGNEPFYPRGTLGDLMHEAAAEIERLRAALRPFAKVAEVYPKASRDADALNLHDARCPVRFGDFFAALAALEPPR